MDLDLQNASEALDWSGSNRILITRLPVRENGPGLDQPGPKAYIKGLVTRFAHFFTRFSFFSFFSRRLPPNPNPSFTNSTQNLLIHGLINSYYQSRHESVKNKRFYPLKRCESSRFGARSNRSDSLCSWMKSLWKLRGFTLIHTRCESWSVSCPFSNCFRVRVWVLDRNSSNVPRIHIVWGSVMVFSTWLEEVWELPEFVIRRFWSVLLILWFGFSLVNFPSSSLTQRCEILRFFPFFFSDLTLWSRLQRATSGGVLAFGLQLHQFNDEDSCESLRTCWKIRMNLLPFWSPVLNSEAELKLSVERFWIGFDSELGFVEIVHCVLEVFVSLVILICNCQERECEICLLKWRVIL